MQCSRLVMVRGKPLLINALDAEFTQWYLGDLGVIFKVQYPVQFYRLVSPHLLMMKPSDECHRIILMINQH